MKNLKVICLGDVHVSARNDSPIVAEHQIRFFEETLFPYMKGHGITTILQTGDLLDRRKFSNHAIIHMWKKRVFDVMVAEKFEMITILGNHDIATRNSLEINGPELMFGEYKNITIIKTPTEIDVFGIKFLMVPWICADNYVESNEAIAASDASYCFGHFEFKGFELQRGHMMEEGASVDPYKKFTSVISGHYHTKSVRDNVVYTGTPYELTWVDSEDPKGFWTFDADLQELEFIRNTSTLFNKVIYDDKDQEKDYYKTLPFLHLKDTYVKIIVVNKSEPYGFTKFVERIIGVGVADLKIVEEVITTDVDMDDEIKVEDTMKLVEDFVDKVETDLDKKKILSLIKELHLSAMNTLE